MYKKEINDKLTQAIVEVLGHIIHDDYAQFVDPTQIKKNLSRIFKANEWEEEYIFDDIVEKLVTARRALWHIRARNVSEQTKDRKNWRVWEDVPDDEKEELK
ncbi:uncharacterized protein METZ01_LOCUS424567 [marine metagenome]|jgi:hypothetical protein|uniref:Uncharacterized protein n=1 Tax=marine metagenome TaxID=408172 RepID=A0A382XL77_9ZZZZ|tara:strand:+ start:136 stop:441 length:306 start_codon:yes stop_codon:yes gene_type:complete